MAREVEEVLEVLELLEHGVRHRDIADATGVPLNTVRLWAKGRIPRAARWRRDGVEVCDRCGLEAHDYARLPGNAYSYLLGLYLGDGCLAPTGSHGCYLRITLDSAYPWIIISAREAVQDVRGGPWPPARKERTECITVVSHWRSWPCLFPQHGPGRKHERPIVLTGWQREIVEAHPEPFIRGLIHTDGWRGMNNVTAKGRQYAYPRYQFSNRSDDIRTLFTDACDLIGVPWRRWGRWHISVARKEAVAQLDSFVGRKA